MWEDSAGVGGAEEGKEEEEEPYRLCHTNRRKSHSHVSSPAQCGFDCLRRLQTSRQTDRQTFRLETGGQTEDRRCQRESGKSEIRELSTQCVMPVHASKTISHSQTRLQ
ncbi:unnamed protein product [Pleuronectes platessa]|uniref:Uncharacterized protein n=1 Tax=Pleuronectes platessa TaxID=8262 RepID=A0A9N7Z9U3_PLEPL|nr:unnamed protein product [Pleuronectes platessa]